MPVNARRTFRLLVLLVAVPVIAGIVWMLAGRVERRRLAGPAPRLDPAAIEGSVLDEAAARELFSTLRATWRWRYDPVSIVELVPDHEEWIDFPEHPAGRVLFRTNNLGFREDSPTRREKTGPRILIAGDSHVQGMVNNDETFPNLLEGLLPRDPAGRPVEVINGGVGGTGPACYLGRLRKCLDLAPDVFVAVLFAGNDFHNDLKLADFLAKRPEEPAGDDYERRLRSVAERFPGPVYQGMNQAYFLARHPGSADRALDAVVASYASMAALCEERGIRFLAAVLPAKPAVEPQDDPKTLRALRTLLGMTEEEARGNQILAERFVKAMRRRGIPCLDPTAAMREAARRPESPPLYWRSDWHLSVAGHEVYARLLLEPLRRALEGP